MHGELCSTNQSHHSMRDSVRHPENRARGSNPITSYPRTRLSGISKHAFNLRGLFHHRQVLCYALQILFKALQWHLLTNLKVFSIVTEVAQVKVRTYIHLAACSVTTLLLLAHLNLVEVLLHQKIHIQLVPCQLDLFNFWLTQYNQNRVVSDPIMVWRHSHSFWCSLRHKPRSKSSWVSAKVKEESFQNIKQACIAHRHHFKRTSKNF